VNEEKIDFSVVKFLVVDGNPLMLEMVCDILQMLGASAVMRAKTYDHGLRMLKSVPVDVLITERVLTDQSGLKLVEFIRSDPGSLNRMLPVIMLTADSDVEYVIEARDLGVTEFLAKPFTVDSFYRRLAAVIARPRAFISTETYFGPDRRRRQQPYQGPERRQITF
jgi:DNA-binding response OmpR family regulator